MFGPVAEAQPAELAAALAAHHVHAALVLLYGPLAFGAGLGVGQNPIGVLALSVVFAQPHCNCLAVHLPIAKAHVSSSYEYGEDLPVYTHTHRQRLGYTYI